ncbi:MAG TPA: cytidylate kinase-like family protein [Candidatus Eisenbacteria bacterium]|jgi:cytidylate kinase|nr:cytidylate kinase-like family protein [Candidatus Eisenbacteria bacterium]
MSDILSAYRSYIEANFHDGPHPKENAAPFVTISRQTGAGGVTIGRKLSAYLREHDKGAGDCAWEVLDKSLVHRVLQDHALSERIEEFMPEDRVSQISDTLDEILGLHPAAWVLVRKTSETIARLASLGRVILVGRGANVMTRKLPGGFHVRLVGSLPVRIRHVESYFGLNRHQAETLVKTEDEGRRHYLKEYFGKNIDDPLLYDLVVNTDHIPYDEAARLIGHAVLQASRVASPSG